MTDKPDPLRERAESLVSAGGKAPPAAFEGERLLHELQVHQVELQLQNEELSRTCAELSLLRDRYCDLYDFAPVAYCTVAADGTLVELNLAAARMLGMDRSQLSKRHLIDFMQQDSRPIFSSLLERALVGAELAEDTLVLQPPGSERIYVKAQLRVFENVDVMKCVRIVMMDISDLRDANEELRLALQKFFHYWRP